MRLKRQQHQLGVRLARRGLLSWRQSRHLLLVDDFPIPSGFTIDGKVIDGLAQVAKASVRRAVVSIDPVLRFDFLAFFTMLAEMVDGWIFKARRVVVLCHLRCLSQESIRIIRDCVACLEMPSSSPQNLSCQLKGSEQLQICPLRVGANGIDFDEGPEVDDDSLS
jgi:hypothetical protein